MKKLFIWIALKIFSVFVIAIATINAFIFSDGIDEFALSIFLTMLSFCFYIGVSLAEIKDIEDAKV